MKQRISCLAFLVLTAIIALTSCQKETDTFIKGAFSNGIFIINEGAFQTGTGTVTYFQPDSNLVKPDVFEKVNGRPLGNIAQSMTIYNGKGYIVVNNAGKVEVVDIATFISLGTITNLTNPSQFLVVNEKKAYVSDWIGQVAVVDLTTNTVTGSIPAGTGPDAMLKSGNFVYVANSGGFGVDSTVTVIDFITNKVVKILQIGDVPTGLVADGNGRIWVLCKGKGFPGWPQPGDTPGSLVRVDPNTLKVDMTILFPGSGDHPDKPVINKQKSYLYFLYNNGIYRFNLTMTYPEPELFLPGRSFYSLGYENKTGYLYASDPKNYVNDGLVLRINASDGSVVDSIQAGIIPRGFVFPE